MRRKPTSKLVAWILGLFIAQWGMHVGFLADTWKKDYGAGAQNGVIASQLDPSQIMLQLFGFREFLAGILWVRADGFFDEGNYDAVLPIIRLCTILDPKQIDIYSTGMWHIAYNFTDDDQRSDRRYVAPALALGREGTQQNPETYELFFEEGWIWYHKIDDLYPNSVKWFEQAEQRPDMLAARRNLLAHAYERNGDLTKALQTYYDLSEQADEALKMAPGTYGLQQQRDTIVNNADNLIVRMTQRGWLAQQRGDYANGDYDTKPPFDVNFSAKVSVEDPKVFRVQGTWGVLPIGTRIRIVIRDEEIRDAANKRIDGPAMMDWDNTATVNLEPSRDVTYMQDSCFVKNRRFDKRLDLSKDPTMYPFSNKQKNFVVEFYYNPRSAPSHIQDKFGWNGEGMTDKHYLNTEIRPGQRVIYAKLTLTRDQIWRKGEWQTQVPVISTVGYNDSQAASPDDRVIQLSTALRGDQSAAPAKSK